MWWVLCALGDWVAYTSPRPRRTRTGSVTAAQPLPLKQLVGCDDISPYIEMAHAARANQNLLIGCVCKLCLP